MRVPGCLTSQCGFPVWADAVLWSARCGGHPYVNHVDDLWVVHYLTVWAVMDGDA